MLAGNEETTMATQSERLRDPVAWLEHEKGMRRLGFLVSDVLAMKHVETLLARVEELEAVIREHREFMSLRTFDGELTELDVYESTRDR